MFIKYMNALEINKLQEKKANQNNEIFEIILKKIYKSLLYSIKKNHNLQTFSYNIPPFLSGKPLFDHKECLYYIIKKLENKGFKIEYEPVFTINILIKTKNNNNERKLNNFLTSRMKQRDVPSLSNPGRDVPSLSNPGI